MSSKLAEIQARFDAADAADEAAALAGTTTETPAPDATQDPETQTDPTTETPAAEAAGETTTAAAATTSAADEAPPAWWNKALQNEQIERANLAREIASLRESVSARGGNATAEQQRQIAAAAQTLQQSDARLAKIKASIAKGKDFDAFEEGGAVIGDLTGVVEDQGTRLSRMEDENRQLRQRLDAREGRDTAQVQARTFWDKFESENPGINGEKLFLDTVRDLAGRGYTGDRLDGAAEVLWQSKVDAAKAATQTTPTTTSASSAASTRSTASARTPLVTPGGAQVTPKGAGARTAAVKTAQQMIDDGDVDFLPGRYRQG